MHIYSDEHEREFFDELTQLPGRIVGLLAATILEDRLTRAIKARWHDAKIEGGSLLDQLFSYQGPVGTFGNKINIGFAIGLYSEEVLRDLHIVRRIRNAFAHHIAPKDFDADQIKALAGNLTLPDKYPFKPAKDGIQEASVVNPKTPLDISRAMLQISSVKEVATPRNRFIRTIQVLNSLLSMLQAEPYAKKVAPEF